MTLLFRKHINKTKRNLKVKTINWYQRINFTIDTNKNQTHHLMTSFIENTYLTLQWLIEYNLIYLMIF